MRHEFLIGQYVRIVGRSERLIVGAVGDQWLFVDGQWWPTWLVVLE
jgi:hypothetical protein